MHSILHTKYTNEEIIDKRSRVAEGLLARSAHVKSSDITAISNHDLRLLFQLYDEIFFENWFRHCFPGTLQFSFSRRMTKSAGKTYYPKDADSARPESLVIQVKISIDMIFACGAISETNQVGGITTHSSLEALQVVFEHELIHVIEFIHFQQSSCKRNRFKTMANNLFGHTESHHCLPTSRQIVQQKMGLSLGDPVVFPKHGEMVAGVLYAVHKRAIVMVADNKGAYVDNKGQRYTKYYVPLSILKKE